jgi:luciferase family oxidoreductase group 1
MTFNDSKRKLKNKGLKLSILDLASIHHGETATTALRQVTELAKLADRLGYTRFWFAEHHNTRYQMSTSPEILTAHAAAATNRIRVGAGGVMLPNHSSLKVAEQFTLLEALHRGRIDLGIGRAPGTDFVTAWALRRSREAVTKDEFPEQLRDLLCYFTRQFPDDHPFKEITPSPDPELVPELFILGSSDGGMRFAAQHGLGFAFAAHISPHLAVPMLRAYRERFQPSVFRQEPKSILSIIVIAAETEEEAYYLAAPAELQWVWWRTGQFHHSPPSLEEANRYPYTEYEQAVRLDNRRRFVIGSIDQVESRLMQLADEAMADEIMILNMITDQAGRHKSFELLAGLIQQ